MTTQSSSSSESPTQVRQRIQVEQDFHEQAPATSWSSRVFGLLCAAAGVFMLINPHERLPWWAGFVPLGVGALALIPGNMAMAWDRVGNLLPFTRKTGA